MTDFGNFQFAIQVDDRFSTQTQKFRDELKRSADAWKQFRKEVQQGAQGLNRFTQQSRDAARQQDAQSDALHRQVQALREIQQREKAHLQSVKEQRRINDQRLKDESAVLRQIREKGRALREEGEAEARASSRRIRDTRSAAAAQTRLNEQANRGGQAFRFMRDQLDSAAQAGDRLRVPLGRVLTAVFAISAIRAFAKGFRELVEGAGAFNREIEQATLGIAALLTATGEVRDNLGQTVTPTQALAKAGAAARQQIQLLQQDAIDTNATLKQLVDTFQVALAPGVVAGLDLNQIRQFTVQISQAASALGVPLNQLSEEIRSVLSGTIQQRTTRIATALGITNEDIRRAKEAGVLAQFLQERFAAFSEAGREALNTFTGLRGRIDDLFQRVTALSAADLFENLKNTLRDIFNLLSQTDEFGVITPRPETVAVFEAIFEALNRIVDTARQVLANLDFNQLLISAQAFGAALEILGKVIIGVFQGAVRAIGTLGEFFAPFAAALRQLAGQTQPLNEIVANFAELAVLVSTIVISIVTIASLLSPIRLLGVALVAALGFVKDFITESTGVEATWGDVARLIGIGVVTGLKVATNVVKTGFHVAVLGVQVLLIGVVQLLDETLGNILQAGALLGSFLPGKMGEAFGTAADKLAEVRKLVNDTFNAQKLQDQANRITAAADDTATSFKKSREEFEKFFLSVQSRDLSQAVRLPTGSQTKTLSQLLGELPPVISTVAKSFKQVDEELADLEKQGRKTTAALRFEQSLQGVTGVVGEIAKIFADVNHEIDETTRNVRSRQTQLQAELINLGERRLNAERRIVALSDDQTQRLQVLLSLQRDLTLSENQLGQLKTKSVSKETEARNAAQQGQETRARALLQEKRGLDEQIKLSEIRVQNQQKFIDIAGETADPATRQLFLEMLDIQGRTTNALEDQLIVRQKLAEFEFRSLEVANQRAETAARGQSDRLRQELPLLQAQLAAQQNVNAAEAQRGVAGAIQLAEAQNRVNLAQVELDLLLQQRDAEIERLETEIALRQAKGLRVDEQQALLDALKQQRDLEGAAGEAAVKQLQRVQERARLVKEGSLVEGLTAGLGDVAEQIGSEFQAGIDIATGIVQSFASFVSTTIVDAFDPTKEFDLREAFARFLQDIARLVIQKMTEIAIAKAILGLGFGVQEGGEIPQGAGTASLAHYVRPRGFAAGGGITPPKGVDRRDTVPMWAQPGEFMMQVSARRAYGLRVMEAINSVSIDPSALRSLAAGAPRITGQRSRRVPGFAAGGLISDALSSAQTAANKSVQTESEGQGGGGRDRVVAAVMVPNDESLDRMLQGGQSAMMRFLRENKGTVNSTLGNNGGR